MVDPQAEGPSAPHGPERRGEDGSVRTRISGWVRALADVLAEGHVAALTGAGISAESGVPTFRDPDGPWAAFDLDRRGSWQGLEIEALLNPDALADLLGRDLGWDRSA